MVNFVGGGREGTLSVLSAATTTSSTRFLSRAPSPKSSKDFLKMQITITDTGTRSLIPKPINFYEA